MNDFFINTLTCGMSEKNRKEYLSKISENTSLRLHNLEEENKRLKEKASALEYNLNEAYDTIDALAKTIRELEDERIHR